MHVYITGGVGDSDVVKYVFVFANLYLNFAYL